MHLINRRHLSEHDVTLLGCISEGAGHLDPAQFRAAAPRWL
jgi:hypothetical protein